MDWAAPARLCGVEPLSELVPAAGTGSPPAAEAKQEEEEWWRCGLPEDCDLDAVTLSGKLTLLDELLIKCESIGDKL